MSFLGVFFAVVILTALFPYVTAFITSADGLCKHDDSVAMSHHLSTSQLSARCFSPRLAASAGPKSVVFHVFVCCHSFLTDVPFPATLLVSLSDSPAEECGLKPGDRILFLNGLDMRFVFTQELSCTLSFFHSQQQV